MGVLYFLPQSEGTNSRSRSETGSSHTAGTEHTSRHKVFAVSASRGDIGLNLYRSGTVFTNLTPSSIPLFLRQRKGQPSPKSSVVFLFLWLRYERILTPLCDSLSRRMGFAFERKPSGSSLTSGGAKNLRRRRIPLFQAFAYSRLTLPKYYDIIFVANNSP